MSEEFDIMKPISPHLDIGLTMFDKPPVQENNAPVEAAVPADENKSAQKAESVFVNTAEKAAVKEYIKPQRSGVDDINYGYLTADEARFLNEANEAAEQEQVAPPDGPVAAPKMDNALGRALAELQELETETQKKETADQNAVPTEIKDDEWLPDMTVHVNERQLHGNSKIIATVFIGAVVAFFFIAVSIMFAAVRFFY